MARRFATLDVFTDKALTGNPLAVVFDADDLNAARMQAIAREFNLSETVFVMTPDNPIHSAKIRIFTPASELPFAGHPTVGTAVLLAMDRVGGEPQSETDLIIVLEEKVGNVRAAVILKPGTAGYAVFDVPEIAAEIPGAADRDLIAAALGLSRHDIGFENHRPTRFSAGVPFTFVPVASRSAMETIVISHAAWNEAFGADDHRAAYVYCRETAANAHHFHARMFSPGMNIAEDAATGSAAAAFAGVIARFDSPTDGTHRYAIEQGFQMGRPSIIHLELDMAHAALDAIRIGGSAVRIMTGTIDV